MSFPFAFEVKNLGLIFVTAICLMTGKTQGSVTVYQASDSTNNLVPDAAGSMPNRPTGEMIGNTITLSETHCYLSAATVKVATNNESVAPQNVTLSLYQNDGTTDPGGSGLLQPGTLIGSATATQVSLSAGIVPVSFSFPSLLVPDTFTFVLSFTPSSTSPSFVGVMSDNSAPQIGGAFNTLWYGTGTSGSWTTNNTWAIADGAITNYLDATFLANDLATVPEPSPLFYLVFGSAALWVPYRRFRRLQ
jgi:hypothetical protein